MFLSAAALIAGLAIPTATPREELAARAKQLGFPQAERIARDALPGARLVAAGEATVGTPRLGGDPDLPPAMTWPTCRGHRLTFLAQLPLADVAAVAPGAVPASGTLAVFADLKPDDSGVTRMEQEYGHVGKDTCVVVRTLRGTLARRKTPKKIVALRSRPVQLKPTLTVPDAYVAKERYKLTKQQANDYWRLESETAAGTLGQQGDDEPLHQILGWPQPVQDTPLYGCEPDAKGLTHRLLLQLGFDERLRFAIGDGGVLFLSGKPADLRAGRFGRLCAQFDQG
jgi:uncharacterized protein YwqG